MSGASGSQELNILQLRAGATVASLLEIIDLVRLIAVRDRLYPSASASARKIPAQQAYREYLRFLTIKLLSTETPPLEFSPSAYIDQLWHAHILDTEAWLILTDLYPRDRLVHDPCPPEGLHAQRLKNTIAKYTEMFSESPLRDNTHAIWHESGSSELGVESSESMPTPPRSPSPTGSSTSSTTSLDALSPKPLQNSPSHVRILVYKNYDSTVQATLESHTNDTIASVIRKYQLKMNMNASRISGYVFSLVTPGKVSR
ncbi:hypothetical protein BDZ91DRAFT_563303 [Kalaharituber pfeilii]|nr:hypothetical protein BDZ91DRAFT_563303 [Kalaharituber pfeilii]